MAFDQKKFDSLLPSFFPEILEEFFSHGFIPTLVGGTVRDFLMTGKLGFDWDIELSHQTLAHSKDHWKQLGKTISKFGKTTFLPYDIIRLEIDSYQLEFSPPRVETFLPNENHHSNFVAVYDYKLPFAQAVLRRDFTINTMGIRFVAKGNYEFLDPLNGQTHLRDSLLYSVGENFVKDPVRFLRAHRFALKYKMNFSDELKTLLDEMNVEGFSASYLWSEMKKSAAPIAFLARITKELKTHSELKLPVDSSFLLKINEVEKFLADPMSHESWVIALEWSGISSQQWGDYFHLSHESTKRLARWAITSKFFETQFPESFQAEFEELKNNPQFEKLFDWYFTSKHLMQKNPNLPLMKMIEEYLPNWIYLYRFEAPKDVKHIDPPYRAKYQVWNLCQRI